MSWFWLVVLVFLSYSFFLSFLKVFVTGTEHTVVSKVNPRASLTCYGFLSGFGRALAAKIIILLLGSLAKLT